MGSLGNRVLRRIRSLTLIELLVMIAIIAIVIALVMPETHWAGSGSIEIPVRVLVFDATTLRPIENAHVTLVWAGHPDLNREPGDYERHFPPAGLDPAELKPYGTERTQSDGVATINTEFSTTVSYKNTTPRALLSRRWVVVSAEGYGTFTTPIRYESMPTATLRSAGKLHVSVGLYPAASAD